jgi:N-acetyl-alpha-D-muramate 1-phosphate uridylyltransferase
VSLLRRAMVLAAGRGMRLRPLTDSLPKPLLLVRGRPLIEWHLERLANGGIREVAINTSWLGQKLVAALGNGARFGLSITWFDEGPEPCETAGGLVNALPFFKGEPFAVINADVFSDYALPPPPSAGRLAHLVLVPNPPEHPRGDFGIECGELRFDAPVRFTFAGFASYDPRFFSGLAPGRRALKPLWDAGARAGTVSAELFAGAWTDVGTVERLTAVNSAVR